MDEEKGDERVGDPIKMFVKDFVMQLLIKIMDHFIQILRMMLTTSTWSWNRRSHFRGATPFKVQVKFDIIVFEDHIDVKSLA